MTLTELKIYLFLICSHFIGLGARPHRFPQAVRERDSLSSLPGSCKDGQLWASLKGGPGQGRCSEDGRGRCGLFFPSQSNHPAPEEKLISHTTKEEGGTWEVLEPVF